MFAPVVPGFLRTRRFAPRKQHDQSEEETTARLLTYRAASRLLRSRVSPGRSRGTIVRRWTGKEHLCLKLRANFPCRETEYMDAIIVIGARTAASGWPSESHGPRAIVTSARSFVRDQDYIKFPRHRSIEIRRRRPYRYHVRTRTRCD